MGDTTVLAAGTTVATSTDITVPAGKSAVIKPLCSVAVPPSVQLQIVLVVTGGAPQHVEYLGAQPIVVTNPTDTALVYQVKRPSLAGSGYSVVAVATT